MSMACSLLAATRREAPHVDMSSRLTCRAGAHIALMQRSQRIGRKYELHPTGISRYAAATGIAAMVPWQRLLASVQSPALRKFIQPLPALGTGIPVATSVPFMGADYYQLNAGQYTQLLHPELKSAISTSS